MKCDNCKHENPEGIAFCNHCGTWLPMPKMKAQPNVGNIWFWGFLKFWLLFSAVLLTVGAVIDPPELLSRTRLGTLIRERISSLFHRKCRETFRAKDLEIAEKTAALEVLRAANAKQAEDRTQLDNRLKEYQEASAERNIRINELEKIIDNAESQKRKAQTELNKKIAELENLKKQSRQLDELEARIRALAAQQHNAESEIKVSQVETERKNAEIAALQESLRQEQQNHRQTQDELARTKGELVKISTRNEPQKESQEYTITSLDEINEIRQAVYNDMGKNFRDIFVNLVGVAKGYNSLDRACTHIGVVPSNFDALLAARDMYASGNGADDLRADYFLTAVYFTQQDLTSQIRALKIFLLECDGKNHPEVHDSQELGRILNRFATSRRRRRK